MQFEWRVKKTIETQISHASDFGRSGWDEVFRYGEWKGRILR